MQLGPAVGNSSTLVRLVKPRDSFRPARQDNADSTWRSPLWEDTGGCVTLVLVFQTRELQRS